LTIAGTEIDTATVSNMGHLIKHKQINNKQCVFKIEENKHTKILKIEKICSKANGNLAGIKDEKKRAKTSRLARAKNGDCFKRICFNHRQKN
jgi:hypothetical protein